VPFAKYSLTKKTATKREKEKEGKNKQHREHKEKKQNTEAGAKKKQDKSSGTSTQEKEERKRKRKERQRTNRRQGSFCSASGTAKTAARRLAVPAARPSGQKEDHTTNEHETANTQH
jgi:RNA polymerase-binding transcription factor DksA